MIFSDPTNTKRFRVQIDSIKRTKKGGIKMKATDYNNPDEEPGYITFNAREVERIIKVLRESKD